MATSSVILILAFCCLMIAASFGIGCPVGVCIACLIIASHQVDEAAIQIPA